MIGADAKYIDVVFVFVFYFFCRVEGDIVNEVPGLLWPFTVHHSLFKVISRAAAFHVAAWSERKLPPSLKREVSSPPWRMCMGGKVGTD